MGDQILATYLIETPLEVERAAEMIAGEQSCGTFVRVKGETDELQARHRARVESIAILAVGNAPSLPGSRFRAPAGTAEYRTAQVKISFPLENVGANLPVLISTVAGNLFELREVSGLRLMDIELPEVFRDRYPGPQFGIMGTRKLTGVWDRPIIGTIIKPSVGLSPRADSRDGARVGAGGYRFHQRRRTYGGSAPLAF